MPKLYLVRHGEASGTWADSLDPGLSELGKSQAQKVAEQFGSMEPLQLVSSPLLRCQETSGPLAAVWGGEPTIERAVAEVVAPHEGLDERIAWLREFMPGRWGDQGPDQQSWRANVVRALTDLPQDTVIFTHFIAINAAVGAATGDDRIVNFRPDNCSVTIMETVVSELRLVELGVEAETKVN